MADLNGYLTGIENSRSYSENEILATDELKEEFIMTGLRVAEGLDLRLLESKFGYSYKESLLKKAAGSLNRGLLEMDGRFLRLTDIGVMVSDEIIVELF